MKLRTKIQRAELKAWKSSINSPKHDLIQIMRKIDAISPRQGEELGRIIGRLESWQNKR